MDSPFDYPKEIAPFIDEVDEEISDEDEIRLGELQLEYKPKILSVGMWVKDMTLRTDGLKTLKKEVDSRIKVLENNVKRLKQWIWKQAFSLGIIGRDQNGDWESTKIESNQMTVSWRRSVSLKEDENDPDYHNLYKNFPELFHWRIKPLSKQGGQALMQLAQAGLIELEGQELSKSTAKAALTKGMGIKGLTLEKKINPQIKV